MLFDVVKLNKQVTVGKMCESIKKPPVIEQAA